MIVAEGLTKQFDDFLAVQGVNLNVPAGQVLALLGPNGAGKTTTVRMLTSILRPTHGTASVAGFDVVKDAQKVREVVGVLTEQHGLYGRMNADEYLEFFCKLYRMDAGAARRRIDQLLEEFGLADARRKRLGQYSKGMRQKLSLARALLHEPPVLLLDEPTSAMDPESAHMVREAIRGMRSHERAVILCTHNLVEAEELADQVAIIRSGRILRMGTLEGLKQELLGPLEYEALLSRDASAWDPARLPEGAEFIRQTARMLRFRIQEPDRVNPLLLRCLLEQGLEVRSFEEVPRSLEEAYMRAVHIASNSHTEANHAE